MGRRSEHTPEELKKLIISASIKLISEGGPAAFGTRAIAREIGYSFGTIYHVFGDLENLRYHVKGRILDNWYQALSAGMKKQDNKARYLVDAYIDFSVQHVNLWAFTFTLPSNARENVPDWYMGKIEQLFSVVTDAFQDRIPDRQLAETAARAMWPGIHGICTLSMSHKLEMVSTQSPKELSYHLLDTYLQGLESRLETDTSFSSAANDG